MKTTLRAINILLVAALVAAVAATGWFVYRPTPKVSGNLPAPVAAPVTIARDPQGVPQISATSLEDALFAQGFVTAQDRFFQMDGLRRLAAGELSEIAGPATVELDIKSRQLQMRPIADLWLARMPAPQRALLAAYARGVNHYIESHLSNLPPEFTLIGYHPRPWSITDSLLCALQMHRTLSGHWESDLLKHKLLTAGGDPAKIDALFPARAGDEPLPGSNSWALAPRRSSTSKPLLANDPHLEWTLPSTWYILSLRAPGLHVSGATLPGVPAVVIGHNDKIAWGITALQFDNQDLYLENIDLRNGHYAFKGQTLAAHRRTEIIRVSGAPNVPLQIVSTLHGPIVTAHNGRHMALKWAAASSAAFEFPLIDLNRAQNWSQFRDALSRLPGPNINVTYADIDGNIGLQVAGRLPIRRNFDGTQPLDGASGNFEWDGFIPFSDLPSSFNPPSGIVATANQNPFPQNYPYPVSGFFASPHRALSIIGRLNSRPTWSPQQLLSVQRDVYSAFLHHLAQQAVAAVTRRNDSNPSAQSAARLLKNWNGQMLPSEPAPFLATLLYQHLRRAIADSAAPHADAPYATFMAPSVVENIFTARPPGWFHDFNLTLASELASAFEEAQRIQGRNPNNWSYARFNTLTLKHPVAGNLRWVGPYFNLGPVPLPGTGTSINAASPKLGPSLRFVASPARWDDSLMNLTAGQSAHIFSGHYKDQWKAYLNGTSFPLPFTSTQSTQTLTLTPAHPKR